PWDRPSRGARGPARRGSGPTRCRCPSAVGTGPGSSPPVAPRCCSDPSDVPPKKARTTDLHSVASVPLGGLLLRGRSDLTPGPRPTEPRRHLPSPRLTISVTNVQTDALAEGTPSTTSTTCRRNYGRGEGAYRVPPRRRS